MTWYKVRRRRRKTTVTQHYAAHKEVARTLIFEKLAYWNAYYNFSYNRVAIRNQRSRWGSCSSKANLNFNYKLLFLPECLIDYVVVHELCHLEELNHGPQFWNLVGKSLPEYMKQRQLLRVFDRLSVSPDALIEATKAHRGTCAHCARYKSTGPLSLTNHNVSAAEVR